jgi:hypothetical protein
MASSRLPVLHTRSSVVSPWGSRCSRRRWFQCDRRGARRGPRAACGARVRQPGRCGRFLLGLCPAEEPDLRHLLSDERAMSSRPVTRLRQGTVTLTGTMCPKSGRSPRTGRARCRWTGRCCHQCVVASASTASRGAVFSGGVLCLRDGEGHGQAVSELRVWGVADLAHA